MGLLDSIKKYLHSQPKREDVPEHICPNCWGRQEYGGKFYEAIKNDLANANTTSEHLGWVLDYADKHLPGIYLQKEDDHLVCPTCKLVYKLDEEE